MASYSSERDSAYKAAVSSDKSTLSDQLQQLDFVSGWTHEEILVYLLHTFKQLAGADAVAVLERKMSFHGYKVVGSLIKDALPVKMRQLETGSQAELVHAVNEFVPGDNWSIGNMAAEKDIMAVAALTDIIRQNAEISIIPIVENKCFLRMKLRLNPGVQIEADSLLSKLLVSYNGQIYISPLKFMQQVALGLGKAYDKLKETDYFKNLSEHYFMAEFEEHGAAVMVSFHEVPPTSSLLADLLEKKNLKPRLLVNGVPQPDRVKPEEVTKPGAKVQIKFEKAQPGEGVPVEDPFHGFREEMAADVDIVPAIHLPLWPSALKEWKTRDRMWPSKQLIQKIIKEGVMIVHKAPKNGCELTDWRLSFSKAEIMLISNTEFPCRQHAHRIFKSFINHMMRPAPKLVTSYHCKTVLLWACERIPPEHWTWDRLSFCVLGQCFECLEAKISNSRTLINFTRSKKESMNLHLIEFDQLAPTRADKRGPISIMEGTQKVKSRQLGQTHHQS